MLAFLGCFFIPVHFVNATSVIAVRTPDEIVIGADSFLGNESGHQVATICKIRQARDTFFAVSGVPIVQGEGIDFNIYKIASAIFSRKLPIEERIETYDAIVKWNLIKIVDRVRTDEALFDLVYHSQGNVAISLTVVLAGTEFPIVYNIDHIVMSSVYEPAIIKSVIKKFTERLISEADIIYTPQDQLICQHVMKTSNIKDINKSISKCIELIARERPTVKLPVDIIRITNTGAEWIQHKPECPEVDQNFFKHSN